MRGPNTNKKKEAFWYSKKMRENWGGSSELHIKFSRKNTHQTRREQVGPLLLQKATKNIGRGTNNSRLGHVGTTEQGGEGT